MPNDKTETTKLDIMRMIEKLEDLKKQATTERSHYYVDGTVTLTIGLLYKLLGEHYAEN